MFHLAPAIPPRRDLDWCWYLRRIGRTGEALERVLHDIGVMQPGGWADWQPSQMTDTGAPVEMMFSTGQLALSLRTEVDNPGTDPGTRMDKVCNLIKSLGGTPPPLALRDVISAAQGSGDLCFGAWLGLHRCERDLRTSLFAEIPQTAADIAPLLASQKATAVLHDLGDATRITMVEYTAATGDTAIHGQSATALDVVVPQLAQVAGVSADALLREIGMMRCNDRELVDAPQTWGFSLTERATGLPALTLYLSAKAMFDTDAEITQRVKTYPGNHIMAYTALTDQLPPAPHGKTHHGQIGLLAGADHRPLLSIGVAAPTISPLDLDETVLHSGPSQSR